MIIENALVSYKATFVFASILALLAAFFTAYYSFKALFLSFYSIPRVSSTFFGYVHEPSVYMILPLILLLLFSIFFGELFQDAFLSFTFWQNTVSLINLKSISFLGEYLHPIFKNLALAFTFLGLLSSFISFKLLPSFILFLVKRIYYIFVKKIWFDNLYNRVVVKNILVISYQGTFKVIDKGILEYAGTRGLTKLLGNVANNIKVLQNGFIFNLRSAFFYRFSCILFYYLFVNKMRKTKSGFVFNVVQPLTKSCSILFGLFKIIPSLLKRVLFLNFSIFFSSKLDRVTLVSLRKTLIMDFKKRTWEEFLKPLDTFLVQRNWYFFLTHSGYRHQVILDLKGSDKTMLGVFVSWIIEESWWVVGAAFMRWSYNFQVNRLDVYKEIYKLLKKTYFTKHFLFEEAEKIKKAHQKMFEESGKYQASAGQVFDGIVGLNELDFFDLTEELMIFPNTDDYESEWVWPDETFKLFPLYKNKAVLLYKVLQLSFILENATLFHFDEAEAFWVEHWASRYITLAQYNLIVSKFDLMQRYLLKNAPFILFCLECIWFVFYTCFSGLFLIKEAIEEVWEAYYVYPYKDEFNYLQVGFFYIWAEFFFVFTGFYSLQELIIQKVEKPKLLKQQFFNIGVMLWEDFSIGFATIILIIDFLTLPLATWFRCPSFAEIVVDFFLYPLEKMFNDLILRYAYIKAFGLRDGMFVYYFDYFLKGFSQLAQVNQKAISKRTAKVLSKVKTLEEQNSIAFDYKGYSNLDKFVEFLYEGFNDTFKLFIEFVCDPEELKNYRENKHNVRRKGDVSTPWQFLAEVAYF